MYFYGVNSRIIGGARAPDQIDAPDAPSMYQGIQKNRVKNDRKYFEFPALLSSERGNAEQENLK